MSDKSKNECTDAKWSTQRGCDMVGAAGSAKTVSETVSSTPATVGVVVPSAITKKMSISELMAVMAPAAAEYNQCIGAVIKNEGTARRLEKDVLYPGLLRYREWIKSTPVAERKQVTEHYTLTKYVKFLGVGDSLLRLWEFRDKHKKLGTKVLQLQQEAGANGNKDGGSSQPATKKPASKNPETKKLEDEQREKERLEREQATAKLLQKKAEAEQAATNAKVDLAAVTSLAGDDPSEADMAAIAEAQAKVDAANAAVAMVTGTAPIQAPPVPFTREEANADATMRMTTELVEKHVWLAQSADAFVLVLAFDKAIAEEIAVLNGVVAVSCTNVNLDETAVILQGGIDGSRGFQLSMKQPSEVEKTDAKKPVQSETTADELVEVA